jgi:hypothetical protein
MISYQPLLTTVATHTSIVAIKIPASSMRILLEKLVDAQQVKKFSGFIKLIGSLICSQKPEATLIQTNQIHALIHPVPTKYFNVFFPSMFRSPKYSLPVKRSQTSAVQNRTPSCILPTSPAPLVLRDVTNMKTFGEYI